MKQLIVLIIAAAFLFASCGDVSTKDHENLKAQLDQLVKENETLDKETKTAKQKVDALEKELEAVKFAPDRLLLHAKNLFNDKKYEEARSKLSILRSKHPDTKEAEQAGTLLAKVKPILARLEKEKERALKRAKKRIIANATRKLRRMNFEGYAYYTDRTVDDISDSKLYLNMQVSPSGDVSTDLHLECRSYSQLGTTRYVIKVDDKEYSINPTGKVSVFKAHDGKVHESHSFGLDAAKKVLVRGIIYSNVTLIQFWGARGLRDHIVTETEKKGLSKVLDAIETIEKELKKLK